MNADSEELARFREQWRAEVKQRTTQAHQTGHSTAYLDDNVRVQPSGPSIQHGSNVSEQYSRFSQIPEAHPRPSLMPPRFSQALASAVETYRAATQYEQAGDLDEALRLYRNAFRLDLNVDKAYYREEQRLEALVAHAHALKEHTKPVSVDKQEVTPKRSGSKPKPPIVHKYSEARNLIRLIWSFPADLGFEPLDETSLAPLWLLPEEVIILILRALDPNSIERFALVNRKARILSLDSSIWRDLVQRTYVPPQIPDNLDIDTLAQDYMFDYRQLYVEHPRLRLDGVYIAVCHYVRPGMNADNVWVRVSHLITYHRYLRFFSDGTVLSLLANEDMEPQTIIPLLKPSLRMKGLSVGNWSLEGTTILVRNLVDPTGGNPRYTFQMSLTLRSKPLGRWNKLDMARYDSVNKENGEAIPLGLKHERPFWFSKVRSYVV